MSRVNEPAHTGPYYARVRPLEQEQRQAGDESGADRQDVISVRVTRAPGRPEAVHPVPGSSRAYLIVVGFVGVLLAGGTWWGGAPVVIGVLLGWLTALLLWVVRKDLISEIQDLFW